MSEDRSERYAAEIRQWLTGRLTGRSASGAIELQPAVVIRQSRALLWWIFEGRRYMGLPSALAESWPQVDRIARQLLLTHNPAWRLVDVPEGETDWVASAFSSATSFRQVYVSKAARQGLGDEERAALLGWLEWVRAKWRFYCDEVGCPPNSAPEVPWPARQELGCGEDISVLRRWGHTAKRSRWPLLRNVVAESLRCVFEPQELDRLPLPTKHDVLFELLCLVRILRSLEPSPGCVRWVDSWEESNRACIPGASYAFQHHLGREDVLATAVFGGGLREAVERHGVRVPGFVDGWLLFDSPRNGFHGVLVEAKSGAQGPDTAVHQLRSYREALRDQVPGPVLVWGIVEAAFQEDASGGAAQLRQQLATGTPGDVWVFSTADDIGDVLSAVKIAS